MVENKIKNDSKIKVKNHFVSDTTEEITFRMAETVANLINKNNVTDGRHSA